MWLVVDAARQGWTCQDCRVPATHEARGECTGEIVEGLEWRADGPKALPFVTACRSARGAAVDDWWTICPLSVAHGRSGWLAELLGYYRRAKRLDGCLMAPRAMSAMGEELLLELDAELAELQRVELERARSQRETSAKSRG